MSYSPVLAIVTAGFEISVAVWALFGPGARSVIRVASAVLLLLAAYQVVEVAVCARPSTPDFLPRLAFFVVTWLPPMGILLVVFLSPRSSSAHAVVFGMFALAIVVAGWIALDPGFAARSACNVVYAKYLHPSSRFRFYAYYYWLGLFSMVVLSAIGAIRSAPSVQRRQLGWILAGSVGFIAPSVLVTRLVPAAQGALPSIMCHFALILAVSLAIVLSMERRTARSNA